MGNSSSTPVDSHGCPMPEGSRDWTGGKWHSNMQWAALGCTGVTTLICLTLIFQHLRRYRAPKEQRQIIRIVFALPIYSALAFLEIYRYQDAQYIDPLGDWYEAFALCALFLLFIQYAAPSGTFNDDTFAAVKAAEERETTFSWPKLAWIFVFQYPIVETLCIILEETTEVAGRYCRTSLSPKFAHIWVEVFSSISIGACVVCILRFRGLMKGLMRTKRGLSKIILFKMVVFLRFTQQFVFSTLLSTHAIKPSANLTYDDIFWGIPAVLTCAEMTIFAVGFWYAFSASEYSSSAHPGAAMPIWKAIPSAMNPTDLVLGIIRVPALFLEVRRTGDWSAWRASSKQKKANKKGLVATGVSMIRGRRAGAQQYEEVAMGRQSPEGHLMPEYAPQYGRPRASSEASLMVNAAPPAYGGPYNGRSYQQYGRSRSPSPGA